MNGWLDIKVGLSGWQAAKSDDWTAIDLFAGAGGFSTGAHLAGVEVLWAANHWPLAVSVHAANHPATEHACQDLRQCDFTKTPDHRILLASPACQGHSRAATAAGKRGAVAGHDALRATAWAVVEACDAKQPEFVVVENVEDFTRWRRFPYWRHMLEEDYHLSMALLDAADVGVPQHRKRLFIVGAHRDHHDAPVDIPQPSEPHVPASAILSTRRGSWRPIYSCPRGTRRRVERARERGRGRAFVVHASTGNSGRPLDRPLGTITTQHQWGLARKGGEQYRPFTSEEYRDAMGFPTDYRLTGHVSKDCKLMGNAVPPRLAQYVIECVKRHAG